MDIFNFVMGFLFSIIFAPFSNLAPVWGILVVSVISGIIILFVFKATSDQAGIKRAKNQVKAHFLAIRLYRDDVSIMINTMKNILLSNLDYMKKNMRPMLFLTVPVALVLIQIDSRYEHRPLEVGESTVISLSVDRNGGVELKEVEINLPDGLSLEIPPVRVQQKREVNWRVKAEKPGVYDIVFNYDGKTTHRRLHVVDSLVPIATKVARDDIATALLHPGESSLSGTSFASAVAISYPKREFQFLGLSFHWIIAFFVFSMIAAFALKGILRVEV